MAAREFDGEFEGSSAPSFGWHLLFFNCVYYSVCSFCAVVLCSLCAVVLCYVNNNVYENQGEHEVWQENGDIFAFDESLAFDVKGFTGLTVENSANTLWMSMLGG